MFSQMSHRERLLAAINGEEVDHVPFAPNIAYYFDYLPEEVRKQGELAHLQAMGADPLMRGAISAYTIRSRNCSVTEKQEGFKRYETISTPKGDLHLEYTYVKDANTWFLTKHPIEDAEQLPAAIAYYEDLEVVDNIREANEKVAELGEEGLYLAIVGTHLKSAFQYALENLVGTENLIYMTMDDPEALQELMDVMQKKNMETVRFTAESDVPGAISWEDTSTTNINPALYQQYIAPEITGWSNVMKDAGKFYIQHACGHLKNLMLLMARQGIRGIESISPIPTGNITMEEAFRVLPQEISLIGGIEATHILNDSIPQLLEYSEHLLSIKGKRGYILANSDSCPPGVAFEKFVALADFVKSR